MLSRAERKVDQNLGMTEGDEPTNGSELDGLDRGGVGCPRVVSQGVRGRMARARFPSDEHRTRPYVRVHLTIRNHPSYGHVFDDPMLRGMWLGMLVVARSAYAGATDDTVTLSAADVCWITGTTELRYGLPRLRKLCAAMHWRLTGEAPVKHRRSTGEALVTRRWKAEIRNFQRKQAPHSAKSGSKKKRKTLREEEDDVTTPETGATPAQKFAEDYRDALRKTGQLRGEPTEASFAKWIAQARLMFERDGVQVDEARESAGWIFKSEDDDAQFWKATARSVTKFRKHYDQINAQRLRASKTTGGKHGRDIKSAVRNAARRRGVDVDADGSAGEADATRDAPRIEAGGDEP